jgi:hypothetical protein
MMLAGVIWFARARSRGQVYAEEGDPVPFAGTVVPAR